MISALLLALISPFAPAPEPKAGYAPETIRHLKGQHSLPPASASGTRSEVAATCHPDPFKGRACRHHQAKAEEARDKTRSLAEAGETADRAAAR